MKRTAIMIAVLGMCAAGWAQANDKPAGQTAPAGQTTQPAAGQAAAPAGKRPPQAKTQDEFKAYNEIRGMTDAAAAEKGADEFAAKYPDSELRVVVYKLAMEKYQQVNNGEKMMEMGKKALSYDPDDPEALLGVAQIDAETTRDTDLDKDQKLAEAKKDAGRALVTVDTDVPTTGYSPEQLSAFTGFLRSEAYAILGTLSFNAKNWPDAETNLKKSVDALPQQPDAVAVFRLAVACDMQNKIADAIKYDDQAVDLTKDRPDTGVGKAARDEKDRLTKLSGGTAPGQNTPPPKN